MSRSRLYPFKDDIAEALDAGTSVYSLARTYGCAKSTMQEFVDRYIRGTARRFNRHNPLQQCQYDTIRRARSAADLSRQRAEEAL